MISQRAKEIDKTKNTLEDQQDNNHLFQGLYFQIWIETNFEKSRIGSVSIFSTFLYKFHRWILNRASCEN
jgi:hypothetical protein